jgi:hypothetical protein
MLSSWKAAPVNLLRTIAKSTVTQECSLGMAVTSSQARYADEIMNTFTTSC